MNTACPQQYQFPLWAHEYHICNTKHVAIDILINSSAEHKTIFAVRTFEA